MNKGARIFNEEVGLPREGFIVGFDAIKRIVKVQLNSGDSVQNKFYVEAPLPMISAQNNGLINLSYPTNGTPVVVAQGSGGRYYILQYLSDGIDQIPISKNEYLLQSSDFTKFKLLSNDIFIGSDESRININTNLGHYTRNFNNEYSFTDGSRKINSTIFRERYINVNLADSNNILDSKRYLLKQSVNLDPKSNGNDTSVGPTKNPMLMESRELIFEHKNSSNILNDVSESLNYKSIVDNKSYSYPDRTKSRCDVLNLNLNNPNYLIETVKGTLVDIFGNILDLNRYPLDFDSTTTLSNNENIDKTQTFLNLKALQRKSIAYHFELNSRKDLSGSNGKISIPDINSTDDKARARSRFFLDIDKEGQIKLNVSASSETGNIPILSRYENYSNISEDDNKNPNKLIFREDYLDVLHDSFGVGVISVLKNDNESTPIDRITKSHIKHGTAHHNLLKTCFAAQTLDFIDYQNDTTIKLDSSYLLTNFIQEKIIAYGPNANAGGRSGQLNFDGSLELNVGANTSDRQSMLLDFAGGVIGNIGRDRNNNSMILGMDGNMFVQIGGNGVSGDSRFSSLNNGYLDGTLDIRVMRPGYQATMLRIDKEGIKVMTAGRMMFHANSDIVFKSDANMTIEAETLVMNGRVVYKTFGGEI